jgi:hypothetical protein
MAYLTSSAEQEKPPRGAEPRIELGPALQLANALYQLSCAAPHPKKTRRLASANDEG